MIRLIKASSESGSREEVYFTDDLEMEAEDAFFMGGNYPMTIDTDEILDVDFPSGFPLDRQLVRN